MKKQSFFIGILILGSVFLNFNAYTVKNEIVDKTCNIVLGYSKDLALNINESILEKKWITDSDEKEKIAKLSELIYKYSRDGSNYDISDKYYLKKFDSLNYFEEYTYRINMILNQNIVTLDDIDYIEAITKELHQ
ncbi:hypothetical protein [Fusibacter sp. 3D3]|uniref:hypothetical protein n=1 Tax=Fusibacter sp. 3D3 TaxID=1048380 RepID=UPI00085373F4|nr:hypothetical protein [Fusibacter sp. 3D3]GAU76320.1 hypothetical protein F3D3_0917 [Fusibacter sp. 3D3]